MCFVLQTANLTKIRDVFHTSGFLDETTWIKKELEIRLSVSKQTNKTDGMMKVFTMVGYDDNTARRKAANKDLQRLEQRDILIPKSRVAGKRADGSAGKKGGHTSVANLQIKKN